MVKDIGRSQWEELLQKVEADLAELEKKNQQLKTTRVYLRGLLNLPVEEKVEISVPAIPESTTHTGVLPKFRKGDFFGLSQAEAGYKVLESAGSSLTTNEILTVLKDSGYEGVGGQDPRKTLYTSLSRSRKLVLVAENTFDLAKRRPKPRKTKEVRKEKMEKEEKKEKVEKVKKEKTAKGMAQPKEQAQATPESGKGQVSA